MTNPIQNMLANGPQGQSLFAKGTEDLKEFEKLVGSDQSDIDETLSQVGLQPDGTRTPEPAPVVDEANDPDFVAAKNVLRFKGWTDAELSGLKRDRIVSMSQERAAPAPTPVEAVAPTAAQLDEEIKALGLDEKQSAAMRAILGRVEGRISSTEKERALDSFKGLYPELHRPEVQAAALAVAKSNAKPGDTEATSVQRALHALYGKRTQTAEQNREARAHLQGQPDLSPRRSGAAALTQDQIGAAAWGVYLRTGSVEKAVRARQELGG